MIYIIDGTGRDKESDYNADMRRGFCRKIHEQNKKNTQYWRGPKLLGLETWSIGDIVHDQILKDLRGNQRLAVSLVGHSRGGAACIHVARRLKAARPEIKVHAMVLFDAVRRALQLSPADYGSQALAASSPAELMVKSAAVAVEAGQDFFQLGSPEIDTIPSNVVRALHMVRDEAYSNYFLETVEFKKLIGEMKNQLSSGTLAAGGFLLSADGRRLAELYGYHRRLRDACRFNCMVGPVSTGFSFGNTGLNSEPPCKLSLFPYRASHGAMGGAPIDVKSYIADPAYAQWIDAHEINAMLDMETRVNGFLKQVHAHANVRLDHVSA